jgi:hypothetical protein
MRKFLQQGKLDGLCGLYSVLNCLDYLCGPFDESYHNKLFSTLVKKQPEIFPACVYEGTEKSHVLKWLKIGSRTLGKKIDVVPAYETRYFTSNAEYWREMQVLTRGRDVCAILGLGEPWNHWTVLTHIKNNRVNFLDSYGIKSRSISWFGNGAKQTQLLTHETLLVQRYA